MSDDINIKITADASDAKSKTREIKQELTGLEQAGQTAAAGLGTAMLGITLAMAPVIAALATIKAVKAFVSIADEAVEADNKIATMAGHAKDVQPTISGAFTEIKNAVVQFARSINDGTGVVGKIGRVLSEVAQVIVIFGKQLFTAGTESDKLKQRQGAKEFAQQVGRFFAQAGDIVAAVAKIIWDSVGGIVDACKLAIGALLAMGAAAYQAVHGNFEKAKEIVSTTMAVAEASIKKMAHGAVANFEQITAAINGTGAALKAYNELVASGARVDLSDPEKEKKDKKENDLQPVDVYRKKLKDPLAGDDKLEGVDGYRRKEKDPLAGEDKAWPSFLPSQSVMQSALDTLFNMQQTWAEKMRSIVSEVASFFTQQLITKPLTEMVMRQIRETALYKSMFAQQVAQQTAASTTTAGIKAGEATAVVGANAAEAASGAAASQASIPYVGWALAAAAFASVMAMVLGAKSQIKSAAGGFSVPSGLNPVTQLHSEEMVLPADIANPLRDSLAGGGGSNVTVNVQGASPGDWLLMHKSELARAIKAAAREFAFT